MTPVLQRWRTGRWIALGLFAFALVYPSIASAIFSEETRKQVLINAVPFFAAFTAFRAMSRSS